MNNTHSQVDVPRNAFANATALHRKLGSSMKVRAPSSSQYTFFTARSRPSQLISRLDHRRLHAVHFTSLRVRQGDALLPRVHCVCSTRLPAHATSRKPQKRVSRRFPHADVVGLDGIGQRTTQEDVFSRRSLPPLILFSAHKRDRTPKRLGPSQQVSVKRPPLWRAVTLLVDGRCRFHTAHGTR